MALFEYVFHAGESIYNIDSRNLHFGDTEAWTHDRFLKTDPKAFLLPEIRNLNLLATP